MANVEGFFFVVVVFLFYLFFFFLNVTLTNDLDFGTTGNILPQGKHICNYESSFTYYSQASTNVKVF